jgi:hypothetical protein
MLTLWSGRLTKSRRIPSMLNSEKNQTASPDYDACRCPLALCTWYNIQGRSADRGESHGIGYPVRPRFPLSDQAPAACHCPRLVRFQRPQCRQFPFLLPKSLEQKSCEKCHAFLKQRLYEKVLMVVSEPIGSFLRERRSKGRTLPPGPVDRNFLLTKGMTDDGSFHCGY